MKSWSARISKKSISKPYWETTSGAFTKSDLNSRSSRQIGIPLFRRTFSKAEAFVRATPDLILKKIERPI